MGIIGNLFNTIKNFFGDAFSQLFSFLAWLGQWILNGILAIFKPLFDLLDAIFYFFIKLFEVLMGVGGIVLAIVRLVIGLFIGGTRTILSLSYDGRGADLGGMANQFAVLRPFIDSLHLGILAGIMSFGVWVLTFYAAQKIIGNFK